MTIKYADQMQFPVGKTSTVSTGPKPASEKKEAKPTAKSSPQEKPYQVKDPTTLKHEEAGTYEGIDIGDLGLS